MYEFYKLLKNNNLKEITVGNPYLYISGIKYDNEKNYFNILISNIDGFEAIHLTGIPNLKSIEKYLYKIKFNKNICKPTGFSFMISDFIEQKFYFREETNINKIDEYHHDFIITEWFSSITKFLDIDDKIYKNMIFLLNQEAYNDYEFIEKITHNKILSVENYDFNSSSEVYNHILNRGLFWYIVNNETKNMERKLSYNGNFSKKIGAKITSEDFFYIANYYKEMSYLSKEPKQKFLKLIN